MLSTSVLSLVLPSATTVLSKAGMQELETAIEAGITLASFKAVVAASADFADFQTRVAAL